MRSLLLLLPLAWVAAASPDDYAAEPDRERYSKAEYTANLVREQREVSRLQLRQLAASSPGVGSDHVVAPLRLCACIANDPAMAADALAFLRRRTAWQGELSEAEQFALLGIIDALPGWRARAPGNVNVAAVSAAVDVFLDETDVRSLAALAQRRLLAEAAHAAQGGDRDAFVDTPRGRRFNARAAALLAARAPTVIGLPDPAPTSF